jgi:hypothetical protein
VQVRPNAPEPFAARTREVMSKSVGWAKRSVPTIHSFRVGNEDVAHPTIPHEGDGAPKDAVRIRIAILEGPRWRLPARHIRHLR